MRRGVLLVAFAAVPGAMDAQARAVPVPLPPCVDSLPPSAMRRAVVRLALAPDSAADTAVVLALAFLREELAATLRARLGGTDSTLGDGDSRLSWRELSASRVQLVISPRGFIWRADAETPRSVVQLLGPMLDSLVTTPPALVWPDEVRATVVRASLELVVPSFDSLGRPLAASGGDGPATLGPAVFTRTHPWHTPAMSLPGNYARLEFPRSARRAIWSAGMLMEWVVGTDGRATPGTIRVVDPPTFGPGDGDVAEGYTRLRQNLIAAIEAARYQPAVVGGCQVAMRVRQHFAFDRR
jgi:hypothetical protein